MVLISIISVNYHGFNDTCGLIDSIYSKITFNHDSSGMVFNYEIIIVDNDIESGELRKIKAKYPSVITVQSPQNSGFAAGNNLGISKAKGDYLFFINNDVQLRDDSLNI
jgi:GT2 family glycosyltransferase